MEQEPFTGLPEASDVLVGLLGTRWTLERDGVAILWRGRLRRHAPYDRIEAVELRPLTVATGCSIRLRLLDVQPRQLAADEYAVLNRGMPLRSAAVTAELSAFAARIERRRPRPGLDLRKDR